MSKHVQEKTNQSQVPSQIQEQFQEQSKTQEQFQEPILRGPMRRVTLPIPKERKPIWDAYKRQFSNIWPAEHFTFSKDLYDWNNKLNANERYFILQVLAFFAESDALVNANLLERFQQEVQYLEAQYVYGVQMMMENVHSETYANAAQTFEPDAGKLEKLFKSAELIPCIRRKKEYAERWINSADDFAVRLVAFAIFEGVFFSGSFCAIYWLKDRGLMGELCASNEAISKDEGEHTKFACLLFNNYIIKKPSQEKIHEMFQGAVAIEKEFIIDSIPCPMLGMNADKMSQYIEYVADRLLTALGYDRIWNVTCPFSFMSKISADSIDNFFDKQATTYSIANVGFEGDNVYGDSDEDW